jgi:type IV pilus assembly protein PilM
MNNFVKKILNPKKRLAGLDIGTSTIKFMEIEGDSIENSKIIHYAVEPIPRNLIVLDGSTVDIKGISDVVKKCWKKSGSSNRNVVISLPANSVINKKSLIPDFDNEDDLKTQIETEIVKYFPNGMSLETVSVDYCNFGPNPQSPTDNDMLLIAAKKEKIEEKLAIVESAGLNAAILDVDIFAMQNLLRMMKGESFNEKNILLLDCGAYVMRMFVFKKGELNYTKESEIGSSNLTNDIMLNLGVQSEAEAEKLKLDRNGDDTYDLIEKQFLTNYVSEFMRTFQYFITATSLEVDEIILTGGLAGIPGFEDYFQNALLEHSETHIQNLPYVARPLSDLGKNDKISLSKFNKDEAGLFLVSALALRHFLRQY